MKQVHSIERQLTELREVCKNHDWEIVDEYVDEGVSGAKKDRPALTQFLKDVHSRKWEQVCTIELSRIGRSSANLFEIVELLKEKKIDLWIKNQGIDTSTITGALFFSILSALSQYELELTKQRIHSGIALARKQGRIGGRKSALTPEKEKQIVEMRRNKMGYNKIAKVVGVGERTIMKVLSDKVLVVQSA
jgi:DNA invertase Pin-like site-specific DNA recombinase